MKATHATRRLGSTWLRNNSKIKHKMVESTEWKCLVEIMRSACECVSLLHSDMKRMAVAFFFSLIFCFWVPFRVSCGFWAILYLLPKINVFFLHLRKAATEWRCLRILSPDQHTSTRLIVQFDIIAHIYFVDFVSTFQTMFGYGMRPTHVLTFQLFNGFQPNKKERYWNIHRKRKKNSNVECISMYASERRTGTASDRVIKTNEECSRLRPINETRNKKFGYKSSFTIFLCNLWCRTFISAGSTLETHAHH